MVNRDNQRRIKRDLLLPTSTRHLTGPSRARVRLLRRDFDTSNAGRKGTLRAQSQGKTPPTRLQKLGLKPATCRRLTKCAVLGCAMMAAGGYVAAHHLADCLCLLPADIAFMGVRHQRQQSLRPGKPVDSLGTAGPRGERWASKTHQ
jgi:hypothetical protein